MARYIATVEFQDGEYFTSFPGIEKAYSTAKRVEDIVPHARNFLDDWTKYGSTLPSLDDAITPPNEPFVGVKLVIFEWEPPSRTGYRIVGYEGEELVLEVQVPAEKIARARALARISETDPENGSYPLTRQEAHEIVGIVPPGFAYFLEAEAAAAP